MHICAIAGMLNFWQRKSNVSMFSRALDNRDTYLGGSINQTRPCHKRELQGARSNKLMLACSVVAYPCLGK
jgi:hypothetical protein